MSDPVQRLLSRLDSVKKTGSASWLARCPCHEDRTPSLSIREAGDGRVLINDFGGCGAADIVAAVGLDLADLFPPKREYDYGGRWKLKDPSVPRVSAADALRVLDEESLFVAIAAEAIAEGCDPGPYLSHLSRASARIGQIRLLQEHQP